MPVKLRSGSFRVAGTVFSSNWKYTENRMNPMIFFEQKQIAEHKSTRILFHSDLCWNKEWKIFFLYSVEHYANLDTGLKQTRQKGTPKVSLKLDYANCF